jgi:hypothetical protein
MTAFLFSLLRETPKPLLMALAIALGIFAVWLSAQG